MADKDNLRITIPTTQEFAEVRKMLNRSDSQLRWYQIRQGLNKAWAAVTYPLRTLYKHYTAERSIPEQPEDIIIEEPSPSQPSIPLIDRLIPKPALPQQMYDNPLRSRPTPESRPLYERLAPKHYRSDSTRPEDAQKPRS